MIKKLIAKYIALDGEEFKTEKECLQHERKLKTFTINLTQEDIEEALIDVAKRKHGLYGQNMVATNYRYDTDSKDVIDMLYGAVIKFEKK